MLACCEGLRIAWWDGCVAEVRGQPDRLVREVMELYARIMLVHGLFHADPHPGNMHVAPDGRIILLDFGMLVRVPLELRRDFVAAIFAASRKDPDALAASFHQLGAAVPAAHPPLPRRLWAPLPVRAHRRHAMPASVGSPPGPQGDAGRRRHPQEGMRCGKVVESRVGEHSSNDPRPRCGHSR